MSNHGINRHPRAIIDLDAIRHNYRFLKKLADGKRLIAVVKADAYGHGAVAVARALPDADAFAVAAVGEALALRHAGIEQRILVLGGFVGPLELEACIGAGLDPVVHHACHLDWLAEAGDAGGIDVWVKVDSGMGRLGFAPGEVSCALASLRALAGLGEIRMMTHLASADEVGSGQTETQLANVAHLGLDDYEWGIANSAGVLGWPGTHRTWVRAGIALYGADPMSDRDEAARDLRPAMTMRSILLAVNHHRKGDLIGYASTYECPRDMRIGVVATGYADGYPRHKVASAQVEIGGRLCDLVGRVSMDMLTVDRISNY